ncbi:uncharacterized protein LOC142341196 isoform X2 [Convolutriloba macropyga]|uniref:uncharacterized protein LOC142341196 isoform X2 n=1 Tax=Convolutriloba macropyga TaxID=536237 RepID=UPI003F51F57A
MTAVSSIDEEDELGGVDIYPPESAFRRHSNSFGSNSPTGGGPTGKPSSGRGASSANNAEFGNKLSGSAARIRFKQGSNGSARSSERPEPPESPFVSYEAIKRLSLKHAKQLDKKARLLFPITFGLFNFVYWTSYWWLRKAQIPQPESSSNHKPTVQSLM